MSQGPETVGISMLPPTFASYVPGAVIVPVLVKPAPSPESRKHAQQEPPPPTVFVPPILLSRGICRVQWCLVLLSERPDEWVEFVPRQGIGFNQSGNVRPRIKSMRDMNAAQVALSLQEDTSNSRVLDDYEILFDFHQLLDGHSSRLRVQASFLGDPAVSVMPEPVDIPTWP